MNLTEATARCWAEIDLDELCGNYQRARELAAPAEVICVLKGNAYGLGLEAVAQALHSRGANFFAVASGDEAEALLRVLPDVKILVLGVVGREQAVRLIPKNVRFTVFSFDQGIQLAYAARDVLLPAKVHIKADTGLYRLGFSGENAAEEIDTLYHTGLLYIEGLFTHLALHNRESDLKQFALLDEMAAALEAHNLRPKMIHALDSIGMVRYPERKMNAVRTGAWLYGVCPNRYEHPENCHPVVKIKARIAQIHNVPKGECVGYDDDHFLERDSRIATLTAGYADGLPRWNNVGEVVIRGRRAQVKGLVCMDQMMVDVTDIPDAQAGDEVTFLGDGISINEYAAFNGINRNETLSRMSKRMIRIYTFEGKTFALSEYQTNNTEV